VFAASPLLPEGFGRLIGPTGGFLISYPLAAFVAGALAQRGFDRRFITSVVAMTAGLAVTFACGVTWMAWGVPHVGLATAFTAGVAPFVIADLLKVAIAAAVLPVVWRFLRP
jgi:biotin transport system substrate-specific component